LSRDAEKSDMPTPQPIEDWETITPGTLVVAVKHIRETFNLSVWKCSSVTEKLCFADLHPYDDHVGLDEYRSSFIGYRQIIGPAASQRFDKRHDRGTAPDIFSAYMQAMSDGIRTEIRRVFADLLQIGIANSGMLNDHPAEWAKKHLLMLINGNNHVVKMWIKAVCDKQDISAETKEEFEESIFWRRWRAPKLIHMQPSGNLPYDSVTAWTREDQDTTEKLLQGLSARFVQSLEFELDRIAGNAHVELAKTAGTSDDRRFALMAIEEALRSVPEDERPHPKVGAVIVKNGRVLGKAHRGEILKSHAEYIALDDKLSDDLVAGATVYTTLEPCTTRAHPKIPCAQRLVDRKIARVVIGMPDPNPDIRGRGDQLLSDAGIEVQLFPRDLRAQVEDMNREFIRSQKNRQVSANAGNESEARPATVSAKDWKELSSHFKQSTHKVRADWYQTLNAETQAVMGESWSIRGNASAECEALCKNAGAMLLRSPRVLAKLPEKVRSQSDHVWRWLYFLRESKRTEATGVGHGTMKDGPNTISAYESIEDLASVSATACMECSADEL
jgi:pyrimidine deaminase RibD-like protein